MIGGSETYRIKRREQDLLTAILNYLIVEENMGRIIHCDRLNSGKLYIPYTLKSGKQKIRRVRLCREGTPDAYFITNKVVIDNQERIGVMVWIECKTKKGKQREEQVKFEEKIKGLNNHQYWMIRDLDEFIRKYKALGEGGGRLN